VALTTLDAATELGVSTHEVRRLIAAGELAARASGRLWLVDEESVRRRALARPRRGRALKATTAWAALFEASGERAALLDASTRSRLRAWLRRLEPAVIVAACRYRADRHALRVLPAYRSRLLATQGVVAGGVTAAADAGADLMSSGDELLEIYCDASTLTRLSRVYGLADVGTPNLLIRVPAGGVKSLLLGGKLPAAAVAVDLAEAADVRTRRAGEALLRELVSRNVGAR
jgi:excisionase family DNA binding protein